MARLSDRKQNKGGAATQLTELKIPVKVITPIRLFTDEYVEVNLHYGEDEALRGFLHCLGDDCPYCLSGKAASRNLLLPVFSVATSAIQVVRMPDNEDPHSLLSQISAALDEPKEAIQIIKRPDLYHYAISHKSAANHRHLGAVQIQTFIEAIAAGKIDLGSIYPRPTREDMLAVDTIRTQLEVLGELDLESTDEDGEDVE